MARKLFGTDGIRGRTNLEPMTAETALKVAMAAATQLRRGDHRHRVVIAKDTRLSGYMLEPALAAGFISMGLDVIMVGPLPTPAVAMLTKSLRADMGVMISASHNAYEDNGIKMFGPDGYKLSDAVEAIIEGMVDESFTDRLAPSPALGKALRMEDASGRYIEYVKSSFPKGLTLDGLKIVVDCAHGAAYKVAPRVLAELGADVVPIAVEPNGKNINDACGAVSPQAMQEAVVLHGADIGIALDGDADRLIVADEHGTRIDGDQIMALVTRDAADAGTLKGGGLVATIMSNMGLEKFLNRIDLNLVRTPVGDRHVVEHMRRHGFNVGGEQSGHIVLSDHSTTGDGLIAALQVLACVKQRGRPASEILNLFEPFPQLLRSVRYGGGLPLEHGGVIACIADGEARLEGSGRLSVRKSGTEPVIRVMAEGEDEALVVDVVDTICGAIADFERTPRRGGVSPKGRVLIVAGSDSGGGAGIQADLRTVAALGGYGMTAITALTAQNTLGVFGIHPVRAEFVAQQMRVVLDDIGADAIKVGMLGNAAIVAAVADVLDEYPDIPVILDPVLVSTSGRTLLDAEGAAILRQRLMPRAYLITPNLAEAEVLAAMAVRDLEGMRRAAAAMIVAGVANVLVKGGHLDGDMLTDLLVGETGETIFHHPRITTRHTHGTGCTLASAIAVQIARGLPLVDAVAIAADYVQTAITSAPGFGKGNGPLGTG